MPTHTITISSFPQSRPPAVGFQYRVGEGDPIDLGSSLGSYVIEVGEAAPIQIRAINDVGNGKWSTIKHTPLIPFVLWDSETNLPPIYVSDTAPPRAIEAANHLASVLVKASGKDAPNVTIANAQSEKPNRSICIGYQPPEALNYEETLQYYQFRRPIYLTGSDEFDHDNPNLSGDYTETNWMSQAGTYHAVMSFIQDTLGVVYGWPGPKGEAVPTASSKSITSFYNKHKPSCLVRTFLMFSRAGNTSPFAVSRDWLRKQRGFYSLQINSGHSFTTYYNRFHPNGNPGGNREDIFALQHDGSRSGWPFGHNAKMEVGDPALVDVWLTVNVEEALAKNPHIRSFGTQFNDGFLSGHSLDPRALAMDYSEPDAELFQLNWASHTGMYPMLTDREVVFSNRCTTRLLSQYPGKPYYTTMLAYGPTRPAPRREVPNDNLIVVNVANDFNDPSFESGAARQRFDNWLAIYPKNQVWRPNIDRGHGHAWGMWMTQVNDVGSRLKEIIPLGCTGFTPDYFGENWANHWPMYYLVAQLLWDHTRSVDEIMDNAYDKLFGAAAAHVKAYYQATESVIVANRINVPSYEQMLSMYDQAKLDELQSHLTLALAATEVDSDERFRVEWVQAGLDWCVSVMQCVAYSKLFDLPVQLDDPTNLATAENAIETDTNSTSGWTNIYSTNGSVVAQSSVTNGSEFAFLFTASGGAAYGIQRTLPGTAEDDYLISADVKHAGVGGIGGVFVLGEGSGRASILTTDTNWKTIKFTARGGDVIVFREVNPPTRDSSFYIDNFKIQAVTLLDQGVIVSNWQATIDAAVAAVNNPKWSELRPVGTQPILTSLKIPTPNFTPPEPIDE